MSPTSLTQLRLRDFQTEAEDESVMCSFTEVEPFKFFVPFHILPYISFPSSQAV